MSKRAVFTSFILLAFLAGTWGNVLAAAFCPRIGSTLSCCLKHNSHPSQSRETYGMHHMDMGQMADMQMDMSAESPAENSTQEQRQPLAEVSQDAGPTTLGQPVDTCSHCLNHSQLPSGSVTVRETESAKRRATLTAPQLVQDAALVSLPRLIFDPREHAPPGDSSPRYLLINVFRI
jgi:hypothetical protein